MNKQDVKTLDRMTIYGGSFIGKLADAARYADSNNFQKLKTAFADEFEKYGENGIFAKAEKAKK